MSQILLVDGYNIINSWSELLILQKDSLGAARDKLCDMLQEHIPSIWSSIVVVFDAYQVFGGKVVWESYGKVQVVFTEEGQTADSFIENFTAGLDAGIKVEVATSDWGEQRTVLAFGASCLSARGLAARIKEEKESAHCNYTKKKKPAPRRDIAESLPPELKAQLEAMRRGK